MHLETPAHLYSPSQYQATTTGWCMSFEEALAQSPQTVSWDSAAILGLISFGYVTGQRTLIREIKRQPWLTDVLPAGNVHYVDIPPHSYFYSPPELIASRFIQLSCKEVLHVCQGRKHVCILLSGGLDSRIGAGILAQLKQSGELNANLVAVTWGLEDSRDVKYACQVAKILGIDWIHIPLSPEHLYQNVSVSADLLAGAISPIHVHRMPWFEDADEELLVLAASYGDSVGRAEYSGSHILELRGLRSTNSFGLLKPSVFIQAQGGIENDRQALFDRSPNLPYHALYEHEMQGHYMRNMIAHVMSLVNQYCTVYQLFTHPAIFSYVWGIHPAHRTNQVYVEVLKQLDPRLLQLPWARTNRAIQGKTIGRESSARANFHNYTDWVATPLYKDLSNWVDPDWFDATGLFCGSAVEELRQGIRSHYRGNKVACERLLWLASFRCFAERLSKHNKQIASNYFDEHQDVEIKKSSTTLPLMYRTKTKIPKTIRTRLKQIHRIRLRHQALRNYPIQGNRPLN